MSDELEAPDIALYLPKPLDAVVKRKLDFLANGLTRCAHNLYELQAPFPPAMRPIMADHLAYLNQALAARNRIAIQHAVVGCFQQFRRNVSETDVKVIAAVHVLKDLPPWSVRNACWQIVSGDAPKCSMDFAPTPARIKELAVQIIVPYASEAARLRKVLGALEFKQDDPATKAKMNALIASWRRESAVRMARYAAEDKKTPSAEPPGEFEEFG